MNGHLIQKIIFACLCFLFIQGQSISLAAAGDVNGSGEIDLVDAVIALQICAGITVDPIGIDQDVDGDGKIGLAEAIYVLTRVSQFSLPDAPDALSVSTLTSTQFRLEWQDKADNEDGFKIERSMDGGSTYVQTDTVVGDTAAYIDSGLLADSIYHYRIRAFNWAGYSGYSNSASAATSEQRPNLADPDPVDRFVLTDRAWPVNYGDAGVCLWEDDKMAAVSITIDDNCLPEHDFWIEMGEKYGMRFTWMIIVYPYMMEPGYSFFGNFPDFDRLYGLGHDVQAHGTTDINSLPLAEYEDDLKNTRDQIEQNIQGIDCLTYAYPGCEWSDGKDVIAAKYYIAARSCSGSNKNIANRTRYLATRGGDYTKDDIDGMLDDPGNTYWRGWSVPVHHLIASSTEDPAIQAAKRDEVEQKIAYLKTREADLWTGLFREVAQYGQERDTHELTVVSLDDSIIRFYLTDAMTDDAYTYPLTVKIRLNADWHDITAIQDNEAIPALITSHDENTYALVKAVPDKGEVLVLNGYAARPVITPAGGTFIGPVFVTLSTYTENADMHYTLDGTLPTESSQKYIQPFLIRENTILNSRAFRADLVPSGTSSADFIVMADTVPPTITTVMARHTTDSIKVFFTDQMDESLAETLSNYDIDNDITITSASLATDRKTVEIGTSTLLPDIFYMLTVNHVEDLAGNPILADSNKSFIWIPADLTGYWDLDEGNGTIATDQSGNGNEGVVDGATWVDGKRGKALYFDGLDDVLDLGTSDFNIDGVNEFTMSLWFKYDGDPGFLLERGVVNPFRIYVENGKMKTCIRTSATHYLTGSISLEAGSWYHCTLTYSEGNRVMYLNGQPDNADAVSGDLNFSADLSTLAGKDYTGIIDDIRIYNRALSQQEIESLYTAY